MDLLSAYADSDTSPPPQDKSEDKPEVKPLGFLNAYAEDDSPTTENGATEIETHTVSRETTRIEITSEDPSRHHHEPVDSIPPSVLGETTEEHPVLTVTVENVPEEVMRDSQLNHKFPPLDSFLPPKTQEPCSQALLDKFINFHKHRAAGKSPLVSMQLSHTFKNPYIMERVITELKVEDRGTNYPPHLYTTTKRREDYYDAIAADQTAAAERAARNRTSISFTDGQNAKKGKWDGKTTENTFVAASDGTATAANPGESKKKRKKMEREKKSKAAEETEISSTERGEVVVEDILSHVYVTRCWIVCSLNQPEPIHINTPHNVNNIIMVNSPDTQADSNRVEPVKDQQKIVPLNTSTGVRYPFKANMIRVFPSFESISCQVIDNRDGSYAVAFSVDKAGDYTVHVSSWTNHLVWKFEISCQETTACAYRWGSGGAVGQIPDYKPVAMESLGSITIKKISSGTSHTVFISGGGAIFAYGQNDRGQLGHPVETFEVSKFTVVPNINRSGLEVSCGKTSTTLLLEGGDVCSFGDGKFGIKYVELLKRQRITSIAYAFGKHMGINVQGEVFTWGTNSDLPCKESKLAKLRVKQIAGCFKHALAVTVDGQLYTGTHDHFHKLTDWTRTLIKTTDRSEVKISQVAVSPNISSALDENGCVWTWDASNHFSSFFHKSYLGRARFSNAREPGMVTFPGNKTRICQLVTGNVHCAALDQKGRVYTWGDSVHGQLGLGDTIEKETPSHVTSIGQRVYYILAHGDETFAMMSPQSRLGEEMLLAWQSGDFADITFTSKEGKKLSAHNCPNLAQSFNEEREQEMNLDYSASVLTHLFTFVYGKSLGMKAYTEDYDQLCHLAVHVGCLELQRELRCNDTASTEGKTLTFKRLVNEKRFSDFKIVLNNSEGTYEFYAHRILLSRMQYFKVLFSSGMRESNEGKVIWRDMEHDTIECLLEWLYTDDLEILSADTALDLLQTVLTLSIIHRDQGHRVVSVLTREQAEEFGTDQRLKELCTSLARQSMDFETVSYVLQIAIHSNAAELQRSCLDMIKENLAHVEKTETYRTLPTEVKAMMYGTCQLVSQRWKKETGDWFDLERFQYLPLRRKFARCKEPEDLQCLRRLLQLPDVFIREEHLEEMRENSTGAPEQDDFIIDLLKSIEGAHPLILSRNYLNRLTPAYYYLSRDVLVFFGLTLVRRDQVELMRSLLNERIVQTSEETATEVVRCGSTQMFTLLAKQGNISHELFVAVKAAHHRDFLLQLVELQPHQKTNIAELFAAWKDPACFEILDKKYSGGWAFVADGLLEAEDLPDDMYRRLLEPDLIRNMYSSFVLCAAIRHHRLELIQRITPHTVMNAAHATDIICQYGAATLREILFTSMWDEDHILNRDFLPSLAEWGCEDIIEDHVKHDTSLSLLHNSLLHAVVICGRVDLLKIMIRERPFHSGYNNAALCEAVKRSNVEMVKLLLASGKIDRDVQREMMMEEANKAGNEEIIRLFKEPAGRQKNKSTRRSTFRMNRVD
ncbi:regulator of chromosome condensation (RCC1)-like protein [Planoprotostelium fungivorum]|uniref:Regulator of chromosome condensation (RCC1)-like protein n=1 Tax=Planoprotostelium fungivorum TaxID=1890364 RepID=A0A2P6N1J3_9EUKA|nr:regulator of chromosome condensation (RCC1)-like protein [Planoprotostelium fungivorum]